MTPNLKQLIAFASEHYPDFHRPALSLEGRRRRFLTDVHIAERNDLVRTTFDMGTPHVKTRLWTVSEFLQALEPMYDSSLAPPQPQASDEPESFLRWADDAPRDDWRGL